MRFLEKIKNFFMAMPFGMKAADEMLTTSNKDLANDSNTIEQHVEQKSVLKDLLKGELTQEVEELRYETFKAEEMSNEYKYIGNGISIKKDGDEKTIKNKRKRFVQYNTDQEYGLKESFKMLENEDARYKDDWYKRKIIKIEYDQMPVKFRLENYAEKVRVDLTKGKYRTFLYFVDDSLNRDLRPLVNFLKKTMSDIEKFMIEKNDTKLKTYKKKNEVCYSLKKLSFTTLNATNDVPNGIDYIFTKPHFESIKCEKGYVIIEYSWGGFEGNVLLSERFKSSTAEEKFKNKEKRDGFIPSVDLLNENKANVARKRNNENLASWFEDDSKERYNK